MTIPKHADLIHAFADGKVLQYKTSPNTWYDWDSCFCPDFVQPYREWRIKPDEPKKVKYLAYQNSNGFIYWRNEEFTSLLVAFMRVPELDREVTLPVEEL